MLRATAGVGRHHGNATIEKPRRRRRRRHLRPVPPSRGGFHHPRSRTIPRVTCGCRCSCIFRARPGKCISYHNGDQMEVVVEGRDHLHSPRPGAKVLKAGEFVYIPRGTVHRNGEQEQRPTPDDRAPDHGQGSRRTIPRRRSRRAAGLNCGPALQLK